MNPHNLKPGTKLYRVSSWARSYKTQWVTLNKIGRKWAEIDSTRERVHLETLAVDGGPYASPAQCYLSKKHYEDEVEKDKVWSEFKRQIQYSAPPKCSVEEIRRAAGILGVELKARQS